jgi:hypothetical protein
VVSKYLPFLITVQVRHYKTHDLQDTTPSFCVSRTILCHPAQSKNGSQVVLICNTTLRYWLSPSDWTLRLGLLCACGRPQVSVLPASPCLGNRLGSCSAPSHLIHLGASMGMRESYCKGCRRWLVRQHWLMRTWRGILRCGG